MLLFLYVCFPFILSTTSASYYRKPVVVDSLTFDIKLKINGEIITTPVKMSLIERPDSIIGLNVTGGNLYGGRSYIGFDKGVIVTVGKNTEWCAISHLPEYVSSKALWKDFKMQESLTKQEESGEILQGAACRYGGNIAQSSWLGRDMERFCSVYLEKLLAIDCRPTTEEEELENGQKCDISFIFTDEGIQMACVRVWLPLEDDTCS